MGELAPTERNYWILNPKLVSLWIEMTITGSAHNSGGKPVYVKPVSKSRGVVVEYTTGRGLTVVTHTVSHKFIVHSKDPIKPSTKNALMVVTTGNEHAGKLVCWIRTFYLGAQEEDYHWVVGGVILKGESGKESLTNELPPPIPPSLPQHFLLPYHHHPFHACKLLPPKSLLPLHWSDLHRRSLEPERSREEPRLTRHQRQLKEAFDKWSSGILEGSTPVQGALQAFYNVGAYWNHFIDPFTDNIELVLQFGFTEELKGPLTDDVDNNVVMNPAVDKEDEDEETEEEGKQHLATLDLFARPDKLKESEKETYREWFAMFKSTFPTQYKQLLNSYKYEASATLKALYRSINSGFNASRRNDTSNLKKAILSHPPLNPQQTAIKDNALDPFMFATTKSNCGLNHPMIIPMLAPIEHVIKILIENGKSKKIELDPHLLPGFLYDFSRLKVGKEKDGRAGLFRRYLIVWACCGLLTLPSSALGNGEKKATRTGVTKRLGITEITDCYLAYIITQIWFALSDAEQWGPIAGSFELKTFYYTVTETIAKLHPRRWELAFEFLNNEIFGRDVKAKLVPDNSPLEMMFTLWEDKDEEDIDAEEAAAAASSDNHSPPPGSDGSGGSGNGDGGSGDGDSGDGDGGSRGSGNAV
ncbi:hypothetical protein PQX77_016726 [Marasmius sp. AFHP31]|nr:hypothetical protein PQX77_016726 [Marasmius sp. AFHP31]